MTILQLCAVDLEDRLDDVEAESEEVVFLFLLAEGFGVVGEGEFERFYP